jgi:deoxyribose-phosphate aldolase
MAYMKIQNFAKLFDHSILRPDATRTMLLNAAETAVRLGTASLTVQPCYVGQAAGKLKGTGVLVGAVIGFPHGNETAGMKEQGTKAALDLGAEEIDMVMNIPALKNGDETLFLADIQGVVRAAKGARVKVILENCFLTQEEKRRACKWIAQAGAHFVKTSTGYAASGATVEDVRLMHEAVSGKCQVKAAGGVRELGEILEYLKAGATRFGSTRTEQFVKAFQDLTKEQKAPFGEFLMDLGL